MKKTEDLSDVITPRILNNTELPDGSPRVKHEKGFKRENPFSDQKDQNIIKKRYILNDRTNVCLLLTPLSLKEIQKVMKQTGACFKGIAETRVADTLLDFDITLSICLYTLFSWVLCVLPIIQCDHFAEIYQRLIIDWRPRVVFFIRADENTEKGFTFCYQECSVAESRLLIEEVRSFANRTSSTVLLPSLHKFNLPKQDRYSIQFGVLYNLEDDSIIRERKVVMKIGELLGKLGQLYEENFTLKVSPRWVDLLKADSSIPHRVYINKLRKNFA